MPAHRLSTPQTRKPMNEQDMVFFAVPSDFLMHLKTFMLMNNIPFQQSGLHPMGIQPDGVEPATTRLWNRVSGLDLSNREKEVVTELVRGGDYRTIASTLCISVETTRTHLKSIYRKLGVKNRCEAVAFLLR